MLFRSPVNEQATPDHDGQHRKIDPVKPADGEGMLLDDFALGHGLLIDT